MNPDSMTPGSITPDSLAPAGQDIALQLRDIHLPEPVSWWPLAPGWWALLALLIISIIMFTVIRRVNSDRRQQRRVRDEIRHELDSIRQHYRDSGSAVMLARELSALLRRAGISYYPAGDMAGLTGDDWLSFLARTHNGESQKLSFRSENARSLLIAPYLDDNAQTGLDGEQLIALCESWLLQKHTLTQHNQKPGHVSNSQSNRRAKAGHEQHQASSA